MSTTGNKSNEPRRSVEYRPYLSTMLTHAPSLPPPPPPPLLAQSRVMGMGLLPQKRACTHDHWQVLQRAVRGNLPPLSPQESVGQSEPVLDVNRQNWRNLAVTTTTTSSYKTLAELEQQLLSDETDESSSICHATAFSSSSSPLSSSSTPPPPTPAPAPIPAPAFLPAPQQTHWEDVFEELLLTGSPPPNSINSSGEHMTAVSGGGTRLTGGVSTTSSSTTHGRPSASSGINNSHSFTAASHLTTASTAPPLAVYSHPSTEHVITVSDIPSRNPPTPTPIPTETNTRSSISSGTISSSNTTSLLHSHLLACASAISKHDFSSASLILSQIDRAASVHGDPMQRLSVYLSRALRARLQRAPAEPSPSSAPEIIAGTQALYRVTPYYKYGYMAANSAIIEALKGENKVHIVDFDVGQGNQWFTMIRAFAARPGGPPQLRITGVAGPQLHAYQGGVHLLGRKLEEVAKTLRVQFEFTAVEADASEVEACVRAIERREGEALAVNLAFVLHRVADESVCEANPRDRLLRAARALEPRIVTLVEREANTNTAPFLPRFAEALQKYFAMFESLDAALPLPQSPPAGRDEERRFRACIEQHYLARSLLDVVACEGRDRIERYEWFGKWQARMRMAGFQLCPFSFLVTTTITTLVDKYPGKYFVKEQGGALQLGWRDTPLVVASAWTI